MLIILALIILLICYNPIVESRRDLLIERERELTQWRAGESSDNTQERLVIRGREREREDLPTWMVGWSGEQKMWE